MDAGVDKIQKKIHSFKRKYYLNLFLKGSILSLSILVSYFILAAIVEHNLWLGPWMRFLVFFTFFGVAAFCIVRFLKEPLSWWIAKRGLSEEQSARIIGKYIPSINDRLLNLIQLSYSDQKDSALAYASIAQKSQEFEPIAFDAIIKLNDNRKYLRFLIIPIAAVTIILAFNSSIITQSTDRIVHFGRQYSPKAPFTFNVAAEKLNAFYNEDFTLSALLTGEAIPADVYLVTDNQRIKLSSTGDGNFSHIIENIQQGFDFQLEAAGFYSAVFHVNLINRPELLQFNVELQYPRYLRRQNQKLINAGNLEIPEGTIVRWNLSAANTENASILFNSDSVTQPFKDLQNQSFSFERMFKNPDQYEISLNNSQSKNKEKILYHVDVVKDQYPQISVNNFRDSVLYKRIILGGSVGDDYGVSQLTLHFRILNEKQNEVLSRAINIPISYDQLQQSFFYNWSVDSLKLNPGDQLDYFLQAWDNDGVNGRKSTKTSRYTFLIPTADNLIADISKTQSQTEQKIDESSKKATKLQDQIEQANQKLKGKQSMDWQDKKMLEDIIEQKQGLDQMIEKLKEENKLLEQKKDNFTEQDERIKEKAKQIQKLMEELLDEETKKLFEELQKLLQENAEMNQIQKLLDKMNQNTNNLEKELERTLELFKELQFEFKLDQAVKQLEDNIKGQEELLNKTESFDREDKNANKKSEKKNDANQSEEKNPEAEKLAEEQESLQEDFKNTSEKLDELKELGKELNKDESMPEKEEMDEVQQEQEQSKEDLKKNNPSQSKSSQQKALKKMKEMQQQMQQSQEGMMMEMDMANLESLRQIVHGLVKLSYDQEGLMKEFGELAQSDPRFNVLAQQQIKLRDDAKVLEDSLLELGKKDPFMGSIITREIGDLNNHVNKVIEANKERKRPQASSEMQLSMTAINNLALMLDDHLSMMMEMMANGSGKGNMKMKSKKKGKQESLGQMQQQLNEKIQNLKNSGKGGRQLSEELAEMAAEQERIRKALQEMQDKMNDGKMPGGDLPGKMEQTEMDLVNKQITDQMIRRQQDILTRLLETEKSMREQDMDEERKGETAKDYDKEIPKAFEEYLRLKEKEVELLKTVPPKLYPYYKKEVGEYFKRMGNQ